MNRPHRLRQLCLLSAPAFLALVACSAPADINLVLTNETNRDLAIEIANADHGGKPTKHGTVKAHSTVTIEDASAWYGNSLILRPAKGRPIRGSFTNRPPGCGCGEQPDLNLPVQVRADGSLAIGEPSEAP